MEKDFSQFSNLSYGPVPPDEQKIPELRMKKKMMKTFVVSVVMIVVQVY